MENLNYASLHEIAKGLIPMFNQTYTSWETIHNIRNFLGLDTYVQKPISDNVLKKIPEKNNKSCYSYFSFESRSEEEKIIFIDRISFEFNAERYTYVYFIKDDLIYHYKPKGTDMISHVSIQKDQGISILLLAKDFLKEDKIHKDLKLIAKKYFPFLIN